MVTENCGLQTDGAATAAPSEKELRQQADKAREKELKKKRAARVICKEYVNRRRQKFANTHEPLILRTRLEQLATYSHIALQQFPKRERFILCADIKQAIFDALKLTIRMERRYHKKTTLQDIDVQIDFIRSLVRESCELGYITPGHLEAWMQDIDECGMILGGLQKAFKD